jgi:hypothetical protein
MRELLPVSLAKCVMTGNQENETSTGWTLRAWVKKKPQCNCVVYLTQTYTFNNKSSFFLLFYFPTRKLLQQFMQRIQKQNLILIILLFKLIRETIVLACYILLLFLLLYKYLKKNKHQHDIYYFISKFFT